MKKIHMGPAKCALDLGDGSERGLYVSQDYILSRLGRPHRAINLMYCYYPKDAGWPGRASVVHASPDVAFAWDYPYDDYFPYTAGKDGDPDAEVFACMKDVRRHGQDVLLTLTVDPTLTDDYLIAIAKDLRPFGRVLMRINHEATGNWFSFTKRTTYQGVADFFVRFHKILKEYAPNVKTILCIGGIEKKGSKTIEMEKEFTEAVKTCDIFSVDKYMALHWGWPYDVADATTNTYKRDTVEITYEMTKLSYERFAEIAGKDKPMVMSELNADGDVTGPYDQAEMVKEFCEMIKADPKRWFSGFTLYQFRDDGRLGLEITDPNNSSVGIPQPLMDTYKEILHDPFFSPEIKEEEEITLPARLRWGGSEDAEGVVVPLHFEKNPHFAELTFDTPELKALNLMMELNGRWFYKAPGVSFVDLMPAFFEKPLKGAADLGLKIFAPPAEGVNTEKDGEDWLLNSYTVLPALPKIRLEFAPVVTKEKANR